MSTEKKIRGLIIREPYVKLIVEGKKTWELRRLNTKIRGYVALMYRGKLYGFAKLNDVFKMKVDKLKKYYSKHLTENVAIDKYANDKAELYVWIFSDPIKLPKPIDISYPKGAQVWVKLNLNEILRKIRSEGFIDIAVKLENLLMKVN